MLQKREKKDILGVIKAYGLKNQWVEKDWRERKINTFMRNKRTISGKSIKEKIKKAITMEKRRKKQISMAKRRKRVEKVKRRKSMEEK